jgi:hypothetical protein
MVSAMLVRFFIISALSAVDVAATHVSAIAEPPSSDADEVYTVLKQGKDLNRKKKENDKKLSVMEKDVPQKQASDANIKGAEAIWQQDKLDYNQQCARSFVKGEEAVMAACQAEADKILSRGQELKESRQSIDAWFSNYNSLKQQRMELRSDISLWKAKIRINKLLGSLNCAVSGTELEQIVQGYEVCFDKATNKGSLSDNPDIGTHMSPNGPK